MLVAIKLRNQKINFFSIYKHNKFEIRTFMLSERNYCKCKKEKY